MNTGIVWMFWTGWGVLALGVLLASWGLLLDWARHPKRAKRRRCPKCWYDMSATPGLQCPECGRTQKRERRLQRARRRWGLATLGVLFIAAGAAGVWNERLARTDWIPLTPSWILVRLIEDPGAPDITNGQFQRWAPIGVAVQPAPPTVKERIQGEIWSRYARGELSVAHRRIVWQGRMKSAPAPVNFNSRLRWPPNAPVYAAVSPAIHGPFPLNIRITTDLPNSEPIMQYAAPNDNAYRWSGAATEMRGVRGCLGTPPASAKEIACTVDLIEAGELVWTGRVAMPVWFSSSPDASVALITSESEYVAIDSIIRHAQLKPECDTLAVAQWEAALPQSPLHFLFEFRHAGVRVADSEVVLPIMGNPGDLPVKPEPVSLPALYSRVRGDIAALRAADRDDPSWTVYITGDLALSLKDPACTACWPGHFELPLSALVPPR